MDDSDAGIGGAPTMGAANFDRAFEKLTVDQRALILDHHLDGLPISKIAERLGVAEGTVKSRLFVARQALDRALREVEL